LNRLFHNQSRINQLQKLSILKDIKTDDFKNKVKDKFKHIQLSLIWLYTRRLRPYLNNPWVPVLEPNQYLVSYEDLTWFRYRKVSYPWPRFQRQTHFNPSRSSQIRDVCETLNAQKLLMDRQTAAKQYTFPSSNVA
jgi:hypothetical protein